MTPRGIAITLIWAGVLLLLGLLAFRFVRGSWSLEDEDVPAVTWKQKALAAAALAATAAGTGLFIWDWL